MLVKPALQTCAHEGIGHGIPVDGGTDEHHHAREQGGEAYTHLVENDAGEDEEEDKHVEEGLRALHGAEGGGVPTTG